MIRPRVSIGVPVYNGERFLAKTLDSLMGQDFQDFELIISDNASTDATSDICQQYAQQDRRVRYYRNGRNLGAAINYNHVFQLATAPYFKWAAHDDLYEASYLRQCVQTLDNAGPNVVLCYPGTLLIDEQGNACGEHKDDLDIRAATAHERLARLLSNHSSWCHAVVGLIRTKVLRTTRLIGSYGGSDQTLLAELALRGEFHEIPELLFYRRVFNGASPSLQVNSTPEKMAAWFDTSKRDRIVFPRTRLLIEHLRAVHFAPLTRHEKRLCYRVLREAPFAYHWSRQALTQEIWRTISVAAVKRDRYQFVPHRLWALLSGVRRGDLRRMLLAVSPPSQATHTALLRFVATSLSRRSDQGSRELLDAWLTSQHEPYHEAAQSAVLKSHNETRSFTSKVTERIA